ncbi:MAG: hypothetical protein SCARUB_00181 [Candidatus Scalindua rubra]|uniref:Uncharacterized protein n=1 Tax=Candidatus Scalindua rubra TaxID=1872076 RepID=A0A1E3XG48_9BACT|nr:MAG: hypothetical protein SCARUB_00181 [Candidatus Scalindua rubra]
MLDKNQNATQNLTLEKDVGHEIIYDIQLVDDIVFKGLAERERHGDIELYNKYHELRDGIYEIEQENRPKRFRDLDNDFFHRLGYDIFLKEILNEYPGIKDKIEEVHVRRATTKQNEGSNVVDNGKKVIIRLYPEQFIEGGKEIHKVLAHELMHVSDMMDEDFGYSVEHFDCSPMEERIIRDRYRLFWDIYVDSRLEREGKESIANKEIRKKEFDSFFSKIPEDTRGSIFEKMWGGKEPLTHPKMIELSKDINKVLAIAKEGNHENEAERVGPLPGTTCTLCGFPSFEWVEDIESDEEVVKILKEDFPDWSPHDGVCPRCVEYYKVKAGKW